MRDSIIQASLELGTQLGEEGLTMRGIASRLGVSATALYQHFESKASILREIRVYGIELLYDAMTPALDHTDPIERLRDVTRRYISFARSNTWLYSVLMQNDQLEWDQLSVEEAERSMRPLKAVQQSLALGMETGVWRDDISVEMAAFQLWATVHGLCSLLINRRFDEKHPAFPIPDEGRLIEGFIDGVVRSFSR